MSHSIMRLPPELHTIQYYIDGNHFVRSVIRIFFSTKHSENYQIQIFFIIKLVSYDKLTIGKSF